MTTYGRSYFYCVHIFICQRKKHNFDFGFAWKELLKKLII